jgi:lysozyme
MDRDRLLASVTTDEEDKLRLYDDANDHLIVPGYTLIGHPTIGRGRALDTNGISEAESVYLCNNDIDDRVRALPGVVDFWSVLNDVRQNALLEMSFELGVRGLLGFHQMLAAMRIQDWATAQAQCIASTIPKGRATMLGQMLLSGEWPN